MFLTKMIEGNKPECGMYNRENCNSTEHQTDMSLLLSGLTQSETRGRAPEFKGDL